MKCPICTAVIEPERVDELTPATPPAGAIIVCEGCAMPLIVDELGDVRKPTLEEYDDAAADPLTLQLMKVALANAIEHADEYTRTRAPWTRRPEQ